MRTRSVAVIGIGAIGGAVAADLADCGHRIRLCSRSPFDRLVVRHPDGLSKIESKAATEPRELDASPDELGSSAVDWVLLATKAHQSDAARPWLDRLCRSPRTRVAVLQNGVDHVERIQPLVPKGTLVLPVVVQMPAEKTAAGEVEQSRSGVLIVPDSEAGHDFAALFEGARTRVVPHDDFLSQSWRKLLSNAAIGGICALALRPNAAVREPDAHALALALMREIVAVGRAEGAQLPDDAPDKVIRTFLDAAADHWSSIVVDRREGRPMEWEARNAVVGRLGRRHGIATPMNDALTTLLRLADPGHGRSHDDASGDASRIDR